MNLRIPQNVAKFLSSCTIGGFSRKAQLNEWVSEWEQKGNKEHLVTLLWGFLFNVTWETGDLGWRIAQCWLCRKLRIAASLGLCSSSGILKTRKHNATEVGSVSTLRWCAQTPTFLSSLGRANLSHWTTYVRLTTVI
jgi:hypothetical protein